MNNSICLRLLVLATALFLSGKLIAAGSGNSYDDDDASQDIKSAQRLIEKEHYKKALKPLKRAIRSDQRNADAWNLLGYASRKSGDLPEAEKAYAMALEIEPDHRGALEYQGEMFLLQGKPDLAAGNLQKLKSLCPDGCEELDELAAAISANN